MKGRPRRHPPAGVCKDCEQPTSSFRATRCKACWKAYRLANANRMPRCRCARCIRAQKGRPEQNRNAARWDLQLMAAYAKDMAIVVDSIAAVLEEQAVSA